MSKVNMYMSLADRIIMLLDRVGEMRTGALMRSIDEDPYIIRFLLGFLFKFKLIEYDHRKDSVRLSKYLALLVE